MAYASMHRARSVNSRWRTCSFVTLFVMLTTICESRSPPNLAFRLSLSLHCALVAVTCSMRPITSALRPAAAHADGHASASSDRLLQGGASIAVVIGLV